MNRRFVLTSKYIEPFTGLAGGFNGMTNPAPEEDPNSVKLTVPFTSPFHSIALL